MIHPILLYGDKMLEQRSAQIPSNFPKSQLEELINDMFETMHKANGVGLSGIQIGIPFRIFIVEAHLEQEDFHFRDIFINPYIINEWGEKVKYPEGCLSVPQLTALIERHENVTLEWYDQDFNKRKENFDGYKARIIQHEYDHLEGKIYVERADKLWRKALEKPLELIKERKVEVTYLTK